MTKVFFSSTNGERSGRASKFYRNEGPAETQVSKQNSKAEMMGIKTRYQLVSISDAGIDSKDISG